MTIKHMHSQYWY